MSPLIRFASFLRTAIAFGTGLICLLANQTAVAQSANFPFDPPDVPPYDIQITQTVSDDSVAVGETVTVTTKVKNTGPNSAAEVWIYYYMDVSPRGWEIVSSSSDIGTKAPGPNFWVYDFGPNETMTVTWVLRAMLPGPEQIDVGMGYNAQESGETNWSDNAATSNIVIEGKVLNFDLGGELKLSPSKVQAGGLLAAELVVKNLGPDEATSVTMGTSIKPVPMGFFNLGDLILENIENARSWDVQIRDDYLSGYLPVLAAGESSTITLIFRVEDDLVAPGKLGHQMGVSSGLWTEVEQTNNQIVSNVVDVIDGTNGGQTDLEITSQRTLTGVVGQTCSYRVEATNNGPTDTNAAYLANIVPDGMRVVAASADRGTAVVTGNLVSLENAPIAVGETANLDITVVPEEGGVKKFSGTVAASVFDPYLSNNRVETYSAVEDPGFTAARDWQLFE